MRTSPFVAAALAGAAFAAVLIAACSDDSTGDADAAACDCPAAEPPLAGRVSPVTTNITITANTGGLGAAVCPMGSTLLGGGCRLPTGDNGPTLVEGGPQRISSTQGYFCAWLSTAPTDIVGQAEAICLTPAP